MGQPNVLRQNPALPDLKFPQFLAAVLAHWPLLSSLRTRSDEICQGRQLQSCSLFPACPNRVTLRDGAAVVRQSSQNTSSASQPPAPSSSPANAPK